MKTVAIIPARLKSKRFPGKILELFNGERIIDHVIKNTRRLDFINDIVIGTDDEDLGKDLCSKYSFISGYHISDACCGSHRSYNFYKTVNDYDYYVSIPADEVYIDHEEINKTVQNIDFSNSDIITLFTRFYCNEDLFSPLSCKIVTDSKNRMIYNSRAVVPVKKNGSYFDLEYYKKHLGIFFFPKTIFETFGDSIWLDSDDIESLEQNRFLQHNLNIQMVETTHIGFGIDTYEQIKLLEDRLNENMHSRL